MKISIVTIFPDLYEPFLRTSLIGRARENGLISCDISSFFSFVKPKERIDAPMYGHGAGMLIKPSVVQKAIEAKEEKHGSAYKIFFSPQGKKLNQHVLKCLVKDIQAKNNHLMVLPARYEGMDARVEEHYADAILSVGDFVLMGGDIPAMMLLEGLLRLVPGVVGKQESVLQDSFSDAFVDFPSYTEPVEWMSKTVPDVVRSGDHGAVDLWRKKQAVKKTVYHHFGWLRSQPINKNDKQLVREVMPSHYAALMHTDVLIGNERKKGTTSVTSLDIHDIARSARTYNLEHYFIVTPLKDQQKVVKTMLDFWHDGPGRPYNPNRYEAIKHVSIVSQLHDVSDFIEKKEGVKPLIVATSAVSTEHSKAITFYDQEEVWGHNRPVLFIFGTGRGLAPEIVMQADYLLTPVEGLSEFNHLSVRSAAAIVFDRWLGLNKKTL